MIADLTTPATFDKRVAVVTGGGSGIGRATAQLLAGRGARVVVADIDRAKAESVADDLGRDVAVATGVDVTSPESADAMVEAAVNGFGALHIAVNAAGISDRYVNVAERSVDEWRRMIDVNLTGVFLSMQAELRQLLAMGEGDDGAPSGVIVNVSSGAGEMGVPGLAHYSAAKHGVIGLTRSAALEYARKGIRVNAVLPGPIRTPMLQASSGGNEGVDAMGKMMPVGRVGEADEVAQAIVWLCSDQSSYVTGHTLAVDGGALAS